MNNKNRSRRGQEERKRGTDEEEQGKPIDVSIRKASNEEEKEWRGEKEEENEGQLTNEGNQNFK